MSTQKFQIEYIAGGVVKDKDGNIIDDSSHQAAQQRLAELGLPNMIEENEE